MKPWGRAAEVKSGCRRTEAEDQGEAREKAEPDRAKGLRDELQTKARNE